MLSIFQFWSNLLSKIVGFWQNINLNGFRPFWFLIGCFLLLVFGFFLRGLLLSGSAGSSVSGITSKVSVKVKKKK
ncbi:MAG: hypothetical protein I3273_02675 [Candidatus Moeniiplasma glomeromycotorum]|nr:hypothetical protein [Candidatus Moeniiplasma glomeromycotorum]MCE8169010.1 hypothetical protein [Candidatus Moeniiplasma glomeromycotorum]